MQATSGDLTVSEIQRYRADVALLSPVGITSASGASSFAHHEATIARAMVKNAKTRIILADNSKMGITSRVIYATPQEIDIIIITDAGSAAKPEWELLQAQCAHAIVA
ncbi:MAG: hypothetical protein ACMZI0_16155 [Symbiopectobacterium sp.]|uniref:hypothetical protein n=1 Tax=Symbiopectobacterium sp. TaxID=2952789 RepID=UPI0039EA18CA